MAQQTVGTLATLALARGVNLLLGLVTPVACRARACWVVALVDLGVGVTKLDCDVANKLVLETDRLDARDGFYYCRLAVSDVADGADVDGGLSRNNLGGEGAEGLDVEVLGVGLGRQRRSRDDGGGSLLEGRLAGLGLDLVVRVVVLVDLRLVVGAGVGLDDVVAELVAVGSHDCGCGLFGVEGGWS